MKYHKQQKINTFIIPKPTPQRIDYSKKKEPHSIEKEHIVSNSVSKNHTSEYLNSHKMNRFSMMKNFKSWLGEQKKLWREKKLDVV